MTVSYQKNVNDVWREFAYLAIKTVIGRIMTPLVLIIPLAVPAFFFFITPLGLKSGHFAVILILSTIGLTYMILAFSALLSVYLLAQIMPEITATLEPECCCLTHTISSRSRKMPWRSFQRVAEEPEFFCFLDWRGTVFIPKHAFASRAEADRFFHTALTYWHEAKGTTPPPLPAPPDPSGVWPPAPQTTAALEPGRIGKR